MRPRHRHLTLVVAAAVGALLIGGPAHSQTSTTAGIVASDFKWTTSAGGPPDVTIAAGGIVGFSYPSGKSTHNVVFTGSQPSACTQTAGTPSSGAIPPLPNPNSAGTPGWSGQCTFTTPGTYAFVCGLHTTVMFGSVTVVAASVTPPPPPPAPPPPPPSPQPMPLPPPAPTGPAASGLRVRSLQRGLTIHGSVYVTRAGSRLLARTFARRSALYGGRSVLHLQVGRQLRSPDGGARVTFAVQLNAVARRALRRNGRLSISLRLTVTPSSGTAYTARRTVILRLI